MHGLSDTAGNIFKLCRPEQY